MIKSKNKISSLIYLLIIASLLHKPAAYGDWNSKEFLSVGNAPHICAISDQGARCWGNNYYEAAQVPILKQPTQISAGSTHSCAIDSERIKCWGRGDETNVPKLDNPKQVAAGAGFTCAIYGNKIKCWGSKKELKNIPNLKSPQFISAGYDHACVIDNGEVKCWGKNDYQQLTVPQLNNPTQLALGNSHSCALDDNGVTCWGSANYDEPLKVPNLINPSQIAAGGFHTCALDDEGIKCWGSNRSGQLEVPSLNNPRFIAAGGENTCALDDQGLNCWGKDKLTGFGLDSSVTHIFSLDDEILPVKNQTVYNLKFSPIKHAPPLINPKQVDKLEGHYCALDDKKLKCWGKYGNGKNESFITPYIGGKFDKIYSGITQTCLLGDPSYYNVYCILDGEPYKVPDTIENAQQLALGFRHTCALHRNTVTCWDEKFGKKMKVPPLNRPQQISTTNGGKFCALDDDGIICWDNENFHRVSNLQNPIQLFENTLCAQDGQEIKCWNHTEDPAHRLTSFSGFLRQISFSGNYENDGCLIDNDGVKCWGDNEYSRAKPPQLTNPTQITLARNYACALDEQELYCWGNKIVFPLKQLTFNEFRSELNLSINTLEYLEKVSPPTRSLFYKIINKDVLSKETLVSSKKRELIAALLPLIGHAIYSVDSKNYKDTIIPYYEEKIENAATIVVNSETQMQMALQVLSAALKVALKIYEPSEKQNIVNLLKTVSIAIVDHNTNNVDRVIKSTKSNENLLDKLHPSPKTQFLKETIDFAIEKLEGYK